MLVTSLLTLASCFSSAFDFLSSDFKLMWGLEKLSKLYNWSSSRCVDYLSGSFCVGELFIGCFCGLFEGDLLLTFACLCTAACSVAFLRLNIFSWALFSDSVGRGEARFLSPSKRGLDNFSISFSFYSRIDSLCNALTSVAKRSSSTTDPLREWRSFLRLKLLARGDASSLAL